MNIQAYHSIQKPKSFEVRSTLSQQSVGRDSKDSSLLRTLLQGSPMAASNTSQQPQTSVLGSLLVNKNGSTASNSSLKALPSKKQQQPYPTRIVNSAGNSLTRQKPLYEASQQQLGGDIYYKRNFKPKEKATWKF